MNFNKINKLITFLSFNSMVFSLSFQSFNINDNQANFLLNNFNEKYLINDENNNVCNSPECEEISKYILNYLDTSINPCDDFFQFTCGKWLNENEIPDDKKSIGVFSDGQLQNQEILHEIFESNYIPNSNYTLADQENDKIIFNKLKNFYNSCMDTNKINSKGREPLVNFLNTFKINEYKGNLKNVDTLTSLIAEIHNYNSFAFFSMDITNDLINPEKYLGYVLQNGLALQISDYYDDIGISTIYKEIINDTLSNIFDDQSKRNIDTMTREIFSFEHRLARISEPQEKLRVSMKDIYHPVTINELNQKYPFINWSLYFEKRYSGLGINNPFNDESIISDITPNFLRRLNLILNDTNIDTLVYYIEWSIIFTYADYISDNYKEKLNEAKLNLNGIKVEPPRYTTCIDNITNIMGMAIGKYFVEQKYGEDAKNNSIEIYNNIKEAMTRRISNITWLDDATKVIALEKVSQVTANIGYPEYIMNPSESIKDYEGLDVSSDDYFTLSVNAIRFSIKNKLNFENRKEAFSWKMVPSTADAYYEINNNSINIPAGIFQYPFYKYGLPDYVNYAGIGFTSGHELTHGFDANGRDYDSKGSLKSWWSNSTFIEYNKLSQCFIDQYNSYSIEDEQSQKHYINGKLTINENIADNGGIARSYEAWKISMEKHGDKAMEFNKVLPGLTQYTPDQLFFISYGMIWCKKEAIELSVSKLVTDIHSPGKFRVNGVVSNNQQFAKAFNCPKNSPMNPEKKCLIW